MERRITVTHTFSWMGPMYKRLISLPNYSSLSKEERAAAFLEMYDEWKSDPDFQRRERISGTREQKLETMGRAIRCFEMEEPRV